MMLKGLAVLGALLALQVAGVQWYYQQKFKALDQTCATGGDRRILAANVSTSLFSAENAPRITVLHEDARVFLYENFLTPEECDHIIELAKPHLQRSGVVDSETGESKIDRVRTSKGMFLLRGQDEVISEVEARIAKWTLMPVTNGEGLQVLEYDIGEEYEGHFDYFFDPKAVANGGNRFLTVLMYLNDVEEGGETCFPNIPVEVDNPPEFSDCARKVLAVKPRRGSALLFHSIKPSGDLERRSMHTACPVIKGNKFVSTKWVHVGRYAVGGETPVEIKQVTQDEQLFPDCKDGNDACESWASSGECEKNPPFMVGTPQTPGKCVKACGKCAEIYASAAAA